MFLEFCHKKELFEVHGNVIDIEVLSIETEIPYRTDYYSKAPYKNMRLKVL